MGKRPNSLQDVWKFIDKRHEAECWPCRLSGDKRGHALMAHHGKKLYAHRIVYELTHGLVPEGLEILHLCSTPNCCNPAHLKAGTRSENVKQSYRENLYMYESRQGVNNGRAKLTQENVAVIRASTISHAALGRQFGVSESTVARVRKGERYA